jgi:insulysin
VWQAIVDKFGFFFFVESLDQMTTWTVEKFKDVRNKDIDAPAFEGHALTPNELMVRV